MATRHAATPSSIHSDENNMPGTAFQLEVNPRIPAELARLEELAGDLWYSWDIAARALFARMNPALWHAVNHSPKTFLKRVSQQRLDAAAADPIYIGTMNQVLAAYDSYHSAPALFEAEEKSALRQDDLIAYFCAEFGLHESLPIYSGGLGILAGDHCKGASDLRLPFVAIGLLYRQGYFHQTIDRDGQQHPHYQDTDFADLPITPVRQADGSELRISVELPGRRVYAKVWRAIAGHTPLYLLDTALAENTAADRDIAHRLYGGDNTTRLEQEILLGIGGVRALQALNIKPTVWHINEGHAAFLVLERIRQLSSQHGLDFNSALEIVAANTVFTTHTPVPAGHDHFPQETLRHYFRHYCEDIGISSEQLLALGQADDHADLARIAADGSLDFNMTALAVRGSRHHNGVSRIHGRVSAHILADMWPQIQPLENPVDYITNGVHAASFLATDWHGVFDRYLGLGWMQRLTDAACWQGVHQIPDQIFWSIRQSLKARLLHLVRHRVRVQHERNQGSAAHLDRMLKFADPYNPTVLTIGFARRFATYKRATLLFNNPELLRKIISHSERPVLFIFAGKAHPADEPGQKLIRQIAELARQPEFEGHVLLLEGYDLHLSRRMVAGVDVWLNNPVYPLEASGTSGMKAAMNGALNLSVADGWWGEGYDGHNGWEIKPSQPDSDNLAAEQRDSEEASALYELLQDRIIPLYYRNSALGYSPEWVAMAKQSISSIMPRFNVHRMLEQYIDKFYVPAARQWRKYAQADFQAGRQLAEWKTRLRQHWPGVALRRIDSPPTHTTFGSTLRIEVAVQLNTLSPDDICVELVFNRPGQRHPDKTSNCVLHPVAALEHGEYLYARELTPDQCGKLEYRLRAYPCHELLTHPFEMGMMVWL